MVFWRRQVTNLGLIGRRMREADIQGFVVACSSDKVSPEVGSLANHGRVYSLQEFMAGRELQTYLNEAMLDVVNTAERAKRQKVYETYQSASEFKGTFTVEHGLEEDLTVCLNIDDEQKVELFEVTDPAGARHIFSSFEDGLVHFRFPGPSETGIWSFHAKMYGDVLTPVEGLTVDVTSAVSSTDGIVLLVFNSLEGGVVESPDEPFVIYASLERGEVRDVYRVL